MAEHSNDGYPLLTSTDVTGDVTTAGFINDVMTQSDLGPYNQPDDTTTMAGTNLTSAGVDTFDGTDHDDPAAAQAAVYDLLEKAASDTRVSPDFVQHALKVDADYSDVPWVRTKTPDVAQTGSAFISAPSASNPAVPFRLLSRDPQRFRVTLHQYPGSYGNANPDWQLWVGKTQAEAAPGVGFQIPQTGPVSFYWADDLWVGVSAPNTTVNNASQPAINTPTTAGTTIYYTVERYV